MKKATLLLLNIILTVIMLCSVIYAVFSIVMSFLPSSTQQIVYDTLHMSREYVATYSIPATINAGVLIVTKLTQTLFRTQLIKQLENCNNVNNNAITVNEKVIEKTNAVINNLNVLQTLVNAVLSVQKITAQRNIKTSEQLIYKDEKDAYKKALQNIEYAQQQLQKVNNIATVYQKTEVQHVLVKKEIDPYKGRI